MTARALLAGILLLGGCAESHGGPGPDDVDPERRLAELSESEWASYCEWQEELYVTRYGAAVYECESGGLDASAETCIPFARLGIDPECPLTVGQYARCWEARSHVMCSFGMTFPECEGAFCPTVMPDPDAGI